MRILSVIGSMMGLVLTTGSLHAHFIFFHRMLPYEGRLLLVGGASMRSGKRLHFEAVELSSLKWGYPGDREGVGKPPLE